jgi:formylglycine-generating enzyme required for sulfatase activity
MNAENPTQLKAAYSYRVRRGGGWGGVAWLARTSLRDDDPSYRDRGYLGFRLVRNK